MKIVSHVGARDPEMASRTRVVNKIGIFEFAGILEYFSHGELDFRIRIFGIPVELPNGNSGRRGAAHVCEPFSVMIRNKY